MKKLRETEKAISGVNVVPIIDVSLFLVIIMLVTAPVMNIPNLPVELPQAVTTETKESNVTVTLTADKRMSVDEEVVSLARLPGRLNAKLRENPNVMVIVRADKNVYYTEVEDMIDLIKRKTKAKRISVATQQRSDGVEDYAKEDAAEGTKK
jgi:biopolymer transport protein ExbD